MLSNQQLNSAGAVAWQIIPQVSSGANEQDVTGKWLKRGLWVTWWKSSLPVLCCRWKPRPSGRLQVTQDRARDSHKALMLEASACSCPLSPVCAQRQTRGQSQLHKLQRGHKAAVGAGDSSWDGDVDPHRRLSHPLVVLAQSSSQGLFCHWRVIVKQRFGFCSSALPLLGNLSQCSWITPGGAECSLLFPWGRAHFLKELWLSYDREGTWRLSYS